MANWRREELLLALNLYCKLAFGKYHSRNPDIVQLAQLIGRTPDAVAMKLSNFASFDPYHQARGVKGLQNASQADRQIWNEFNSNWAELAVESEVAYTRLLNQTGSETTEFSAGSSLEKNPVFSGETESEHLVKIRLGQAFFRKVVLTSYGTKCCLCGMPIPQMLIASHIVPWRDEEKLRVNPYNGLCLCALHDKGFDRGLFTLDENYEVVVGRAVGQYLPNSAVYDGFKVYEGKMISLPDKFLPNQEYLAIHRLKYFVA